MQSQPAAHPAPTVRRFARLHVFALSMLLLVLLCGGVALAAQPAAAQEENELSIELVGTIDMAEGASDVQVVGNYAYVAAHNSGLQILDISDPTRPTSIGGKEIWSSGSVYVAGNHAYIGAWYGLNILDVSNPVEPAMKGNYRLTNDGVSDVHVLDGYAYSSIEPASHHVPSFISIIDVRDPANPDTVGDRIGGYRIGGYGEDDIRDSLPYRKYVPISNKGRLAIRATHGTLPA